MSKINWVIKKFTELSNVELYDILHLRSEVFVIEQDCIYQDIDFFDQKAWHIAGYIDDELVVYARIFAPGIKYKETAIGRVVSHSKVRGSGLGRVLMKKSIEFCFDNFPEVAIRISAQCYLSRFYQSLGFKIVSEVYQEDEIDHQEMLYQF